MSALYDFYLGLHPLVRALLGGLGVIAVLMPLAGLGSLAERKVSAWIQGRVGPNRAIIPWLAWVPGIGILQRLGLFHLAADGAKMLLKEEPVPGHVNRFYYILAPIVALVPALVTVCVVPFGAWYGEDGVMRPLILANVDVGILFLFAVSSLGVYSIILAGWSANSKYPFLGGIRASAQMISYEISMGLSVVPIFLWVNGPGADVGTLSLVRVVEGQNGLWFALTFPVSALIFLTSVFAETNRAPFDMPESESELVGGFHTEYGAFKFGLFFASEYAHVIVGSAVFVLLFLGGWNFLPFVPFGTVAEVLPALVQAVLSVGWFLAKVLAMVFFFMWIRWTLPRYRYDLVMGLGWRVLLPLAIGNLVVYAIGIAVVDTVSR